MNVRPNDLVMNERAPLGYELVAARQSTSVARLKTPIRQVAGGGDFLAHAFDSDLLFLGVLLASHRLVE